MSAAAKHELQVEHRRTKTALKIGLAHHEDSNIDTDAANDG
jgi:hypothetical protein